MIIVFSLVLLAVGYLCGYVLHIILIRMRWGKTTCNIQKKGMLLRGIGGVVVLGVSLYFALPSLGIVAGFMLYESRHRWCIIRNFHS